LFPFGTIVNFFIHRFANLSAGEPAKACQTRKMRSQMFASGGQWNQKYEHGFIHLVILLESPARRCITKRHWPCFAPFVSYLSFAIGESGIKLRLLCAKIAQNDISQIPQNP